MISLSEIRNRALKFSKEWEDTTYERGEAQSFWNDFFQIFDVPRRRVPSFEEPVKKLGGAQGFIDLFWRGQLLIEHKSFGKNLSKAKTQALEYFPNIPNRDLPKFILVCDFQNFELYDLDENLEYHFSLKELHKNIELFAFIAGYQKKSYKEEEPTNRKAAELMGKLHDKLLENGYEGHELELFLTRLLFCNFAEDTGIFAKNSFREFIELYTDEEGRNLGAQINYLFQIFDTPNDKRPKNLDESFAAFPYINGAIFSEQIRIANFDSSMREMLLDACAFDWSLISPAIFGSMFQASMDKDKRGELGAHFTSEKNILKAIKPLFLDELWAEFEKIKNSQKQLQAFHAKLSNLTFLDPACGSGNFLVVAFRELKLLEFEVLKALKSLTPLVHIDQFYGFEIEELPSRITATAMLLIDHQMNLHFAQNFGEPHFNIPIKESAHILHVNALREDWESLLAGVTIDYIIGNPPFLGHQLRTSEQVKDMHLIFGTDGQFNRLDYVCAWYIKAAKFIQNKKSKVALVSTNSISQGEQASILWEELIFKYGIKIHFAHRTFKWNNEAKRNAAVHCVIIGFANYDIENKRLFEYEKIDSEPHEIRAKNINGYLVDAMDIILPARSKPISQRAQMIKGSQPTDGGYLILSEDEKAEFESKCPELIKYVKLYMGAEEFINNKKRYCFWLKNAEPSELLKCQNMMERLEKVRQTRLQSPTKSVREAANTPTLFTQDRQPIGDYLIVPSHSSESRHYIPLGFYDKDTIATNANMIISNAKLFDFAILTSNIHMAWMKTVCGRIKSDYRYTPAVYNNFPFPLHVNEAQEQSIEKLAQAILDARAQFPSASLADLYHPLTMPPVLLKAHEALDKAVDKLYKKEGFKTDVERVAHLFELNRSLTSLVLEEKPKKREKLSK